LTTSFSMLPTIVVRLADFCKIGFNYCLGVALPIGKNFWFDWNKVYTAAQKMHLNLDEWVTGRLAYFLKEKQPKSKILIFYGAIENRFVLSVCSRRHVNFIPAFRETADMPGYCQVRHDFLIQTAQPFLLYDGATLIRLYPLALPDQRLFFLCNFGNQRGNLFEKADKKFYFRLLNHKDRYFDLAPVPKLPVSELSFLNRSLVIAHAFCTIA